MDQLPQVIGGVPRSAGHDRSNRRLDRADHLGGPTEPFGASDGAPPELEDPKPRVAHRGPPGDAQRSASVLRPGVASFWAHNAVAAANIPRAKTARSSTTCSIRIISSGAVSHT